MHGIAILTRGGLHSLAAAGRAIWATLEWRSAATRLPRCAAAAALRARRAARDRGSAAGAGGGGPAAGRARDAAALRVGGAAAECVAAAAAGGAGAAAALGALAAAEALGGHAGGAPGAAGARRAAVALVRVRAFGLPVSTAVAPLFDVAVAAPCSPQIDGVPPGAEQAGGAVQAAPAAVRAQLVDAARVALAGHEDGEERGSAERQLPHALPAAWRRAGA